MIYKLLHILTVIFFALADSSCRSVPTPEPTLPIGAPATKADEDFINEFAKPLNLHHIVLRCRVFDLLGRPVAFLRAQMCWIGDDGHVIKANYGITMEVNERSGIVWRQEWTYFHHMLSKSMFREEFLTLNSEYKAIEGYSQVRYDEPVIFNRAGKIIKRFKMSEYINHHPRTGPPMLDNWSFQLPMKAWEYTHGNTFKETWKIKNGIKVHTGYIFFSNQERVLYFLNKALTKVTRTIEAGRPLHDVQQYDEDHLIAYGNAQLSDVAGGIFLIDLKSGALERIYKFTRKEQFSHACSSVQPLPDNKFFLVHSQCEDPNATDTVVEFLDLKSGRNAFLRLKTYYSIPNGHLEDLTSYFDKSYSH